jgi:hypothetical protein
MSDFWLGIIGTLVGSALTLLGQWVKHCWEVHAAQKLDNVRKAMLTQMLNNPGPDGWRKMSTLAGVIGASRDETARLLIGIEARSSETESDVWAYIKDKPIPKSDQ